MTMIKVNEMIWLMVTIFLEIGNSNMSSEENISFVTTMRNKIYQWTMNYNLFEDSYTSEHTRRNEILSTRLYLLLMIIGLIAITFYTSIIQHTITYHVKLPSLHKYRQLVNRYPSLTCECQQTTTSYSVFVSFSPTFHQVCLSIYAQSTFTTRYGNTSGTFFLGRFSYSATMTSIVGAIRTLCNIAKGLASESIETYLEQTYISTYLTHESEFTSSMNISLKNFKASISTRITQIIQLLRYITQGNQLLSSVFSNAKMLYNASSTDEENKINILWSNPINESCNCGVSSDSCAVFYDDYCNHTYTYQFIDDCPLPTIGVAVACYSFDACLFSTLQCFFDSVCANIL